MLSVNFTRIVVLSWARTRPLYIHNCFHKNTYYNTKWIKSILSISYSGSAMLTAKLHWSVFIAKKQRSSHHTSKIFTMLTYIFRASVSSFLAYPRSRSHYGWKVRQYHTSIPHDTLYITHSFFGCSLILIVKAVPRVVPASTWTGDTRKNLENLFCYGFGETWGRGVP